MSAQSEKLLQAIGELDEELVEDAAPLAAVPKKRGRRWARGIIAAAVAAALLVGTAFAASPGLRDMLAEVLGSFGPYAQKQEDAIYTWNGFEFQVMAALADENTVRVYVQARDTRGKHRLDMMGHYDAWMDGGPDALINVPQTSVEIRGGKASTSFLPYDAETQTAILTASMWGRITDDLTGAELCIDNTYNIFSHPLEAALKIPLDIEVMPSRTLLRFQDLVLDDMEIEEIRVSALGITAVAKKEMLYTSASLDTTFRVQLKDGTEIRTEKDANSGYGIYMDEAGNEHQAFIWSFADPLEPDSIAGVYIGEGYYPVDGAGELVQEVLRKGSRPNDWNSRLKDKNQRPRPRNP